MIEDAFITASDAVKQYINEPENENGRLKESLANNEHTIIQFGQQVKNLERKRDAAGKAASGVIQTVWERGGEVYRHRPVAAI
jgi:hypothetical protein